MLGLVATWLQEASDFAWPLVAALVVVIFRKELRQLISGITNFRYRGPVRELEMSADARDDVTSDTATAGEEPAEDDDNVVRTTTDSAALSAKSQKDKQDDGSRDKSDSEEDESPQQLRLRIFDALRDDEDERAQVLFDKLRSREDDPVRRKAHQAYWLWVRFVNNKEPKALDKLNDLAADKEVTTTARLYRGLSLSWAGEPAAAAADYALARDAAPNEKSRTDAIADRAEALDAAGNYDQAVEELEAALREVENPEGRARLWSGLAGVYAKHDKHQLRALALQRALEVSPNDNRLRFSVAWAYWNADFEMFTPAMVHHFGTVLRFDPGDDAARNNLGVIYQRSDMSILAVHAFQRAKGDGHTLAAANLANRYLQAGFADDAEKLVREAAQAKNPHQNVAAVTADIARAREEQQEKRDELQPLGEQQAGFLGCYSEARIELSRPFTGTWRFQHNGPEVQISEADGALLGEWTVGRVKWKFEGAIYGASAKLKVSEMEYSRWSSKQEETGFSKRREAFGYLADDGQSFELMEIKDEDITFRSLQRVD